MNVSSCNTVLPWLRFSTPPVLLLLVAILSGCQSQAGRCELIRLGSDGRLLYSTYNARGDKIPDFSYAGYRGGGVAIPDVPTVRELSPQASGDDTARIQQAIDEVAAMSPDKNSFRGALLLKAGTYRVAGAIHIRSSGVVLRGQGQKKDGTIIVATGTQKRDLILVCGGGERTIVESTVRKIADHYVPVGSRTITLEGKHRFQAGDQVIIRRPSTANWIHDIGMNRIVSTDGSDVHLWEAEKFDLYFDRTITGVDDARITLDVPLTNSLDQEYGGGLVAKYEFPEKIREVGIEDIRLISEYKTPEDEDHAFHAILFDKLENAWIKNVTMSWFVHGVYFDRLAKFVTVQDCAFLDSASQIIGGRRYPFTIGRGQLILIQRCYARHCRHDYSTGRTACGPSAFVDCVSEDAYNEIGPHHRWANGQLYDNIFVIHEFNPYFESGGMIVVQDRGNWGAGHGWAGANQVFWNCTSPAGFVCQKPPTAQNFAIGCIGPINPVLRFKDRPGGHYESHCRHVAPRSLYLAQLKDRLGQQAVNNIATDWQQQGRATEVILKTLKE